MANEGVVEETVLIKFAQKLAGNEKKFRDRALKKLRHFLESRARSPKGVFSEGDFLKIWKGLHYCMWMADKPLVQEELASSLASLIRCFKSPQQAFLFIEVFFQTESREWFGIDRLRLDKFMMLVRKMLAGSMELLKRLSWKVKFIKTFNKILSKGVVSANSSTPDGLKFHVTDIFMGELEKAGAGELKPKQLEQLLQPFIQLVLQTKSPIMLRHVLKTVFFRIVDYGVESILQKQKEEERMEGGEGEEEEEEEEEEGGEDDPFSENFIPLEVNLKRLSGKLLQLAASEHCHNHNRKDIYSLVKTYQDLAVGILPAEEAIEDEDLDEDDIDYDGAVQRLATFETKLMKRTGKKRKQKKGVEESLEPPVKRQKQENGKEESKEVKKGKNKFKSEGDTKKKKGKEKMEKKKKVVKEKKTQKKEQVNVFSGGFFDDDDEDNEMINNAGMETETVENGLETFEDDEEDLEVSFRATEELSSVKKLKKKKLKKQVNQEVDDPSPKVLEDPTEGAAVTSLKKKAKRKSLEVANGDSDVVSSGDGVPKSPKDKLGKKKKRKSLGDVEEQIAEVKKVKKVKKLERRKSLGGSSAQTETVEVVEKKKKQRRKSLNDLEAGDVEIWVPNKKYSGKMKEWFEEQQKKSLDLESPNETKTKELISFTASSKAPPAFVRRSLDKVSPKSKKSQLSKVDTPTNPGSGKKRVSFIMSKNEMRALKSNQILSPLPAFNPNEKPASPIIKLSDNSPALSPANVNLKKLTKMNTSKNTPKTFPIIMKGKVKARVRASDFF